MKVRILGCGAAGGVPMISRGWGACDPKNPKNRRRRSSILIEIDGKRILVDTSPDLREQLLDANVNALDAVLYTHEHADHLHGIDDLREVNRVIKAPLPVFANRATLNHLKKHFPHSLSPTVLSAVCGSMTAREKKKTLHISPSSTNPMICSASREK